MIKIYISKADATLNIDWDAMPEVAKQHIIEYGLRQKLNDAGSSATKKELGAQAAGEQALAMAEVSLAALMNGQTKTRVARSAMPLEDKFFLKELKALYKKVFKSTMEMETNLALDSIAKELGRDVSELEEALTKKALAEVEAHKKIQEIKANLPTVTF